MASVSSNRRSASAVDQFIKAVKAALESKGWTIVALAEKTGLSRPYLSKVLGGHQKPSMEKAEQIARPLGLEVTTGPRKKTA